MEEKEGRERLRIVRVEVEPSLGVADHNVAFFLLLVSNGEEKWYVRSRYSEMLLLQQKLEQRHRRRRLPPYPPKVWIMTEEKLEHRRACIESFFAGLLGNENLRDDPDLVSFLTSSKRTVKS